MTKKRFGNRLLKISGYILGFLLVAATAFHFWFKAHALHLIEDMVESRTNGKIRLKVDKFSFNWLTRKMEFRDAVFISTDTTTATTAYRFSVDRIKLKVDAILPIVFKKRIIIDTLTLLDPEIRVTRLKRKIKKDSGIEKDVSLPEEMGEIYNSIQDALKVLRVSRFMIDRGSFVLVNNIVPGQRPVTISNLFFQIDNLSVDTTIRGARDKILFSDNVILRSHNQDILFPDERHRLAFSKFSINLQQKLVEFDSCTIAAVRTDSSAAAFTMYMDALKLIDIDFDTLYKTEVIKADSVYCVNPKFNLAVEIGKKKDDNKSPPSLEKIIQQLTGNLELDNVVVSNADFNINTIKDGVPSSFTFSENNFEMQGLRIDQAAKSPISVRSFAMAIRNYENFLKDSSYSVRFDSVLFRDDRIYLSNFIFHKLDRGRVINTFNIPQFYLGGLSWDALVFEKKLKADQATLFNPHIDYTVSSQLRRPSGKGSVFESIASINEVMDLGYLDIMDGHIDLKVNKDVRIQLNQATLSIQSHNLLQSRQLAGIKNSLTSLDFRDGIIHTGDLLIHLDDIRYLGETGHFTAKALRVTDRNNKMALDLENVLVDKMIVDEKSGDILSENISWGKGKVNLNFGSSGKDLRSVLELYRIRGANTEFTGTAGNSRFSTHIDRLSFEELNKYPGEKVHISGLSIDGKDLRFRKGNTVFNVNDYKFKDETAAELERVRFSSENTNVSVPLVRFVPFLSTIIAGTPRFEKALMVNPVIKSGGSGGTSKLSLPQMEITELSIEQPDIDIRGSNDSGSYQVRWRAKNNSDMLHLSGLVNKKAEFSNLKLDQLRFHISNFDLLTATGKKFNTGSGHLAGNFRDIGFAENEKNADWKAMVSSLEARDILFDSIGIKKNRFYIARLFLKELGLDNSSVNNLENLTQANAKFRLDGFNGEFTNESSVLRWYNAAMSRPDKTFSLDSLRWDPRISPDSFMSAQKVQKDYIKLQTGRIFLNNADIEAFIRNNTIAGDRLSITEPVLTVTRDTRLRFDSGRIKPLLTGMLRKIEMPLLVRDVRAHNGSVFYAEIPKSGVPATIPITDIELDIAQVKNLDYNVDDSLRAFVTGKIFDSVRLYLRLNQSYNDSLGGFRVDVAFGPSRLGVLNEAFVPLGSLYIRSGELDTANLSVVANEYFAYGEMKMDYRDLKLQLLKEPGNTDRKNTKNFLTFLANTFVIKNKDSKPGVVFVVRNRERSIFNYLVKIATRGFQSSIGVGNNKKLTRRYKEELKKRNLPAFNFEKAEK